MARPLGYPLYMNGALLKDPVQFSHVPSVDGYGAFGSDVDGMQSQGEQYPVRHSDMVQANAGYGGAQYNPASYPMAPFGASPDGIGATSRLVPQQGAIKSGVLGTMLSGSPLLRGFQAVSGLGADAPAPGTGVAVAAASGMLVAAVVVGVALSAVGGYYVGKAVAPSHDRESKYAWWGVVAALLGGPVGLGIEAAVALNHKGR